MIMAKDAFDNIMAGLSDALAYAEGDKSHGKRHLIKVPAVDVAAVRKKLGTGAIHQTIGVVLIALLIWALWRPAAASDVSA